MKERWIEYLTTKFRPKFDGKKLPRIAIDCAYGSGAEVAKAVLEGLGFDFVLFNTEYDGKNINKGDAQKDSEKFDLVFEFDGDADRCLLDEIPGDILIAQLAAWLGVEVVVSTVLFNSGTEKWLKDNGVQLARTPVGDRFISAELDKLKRMDRSCIGGEPSGHIIFPDVFHSGDGLITVLMVCAMFCDVGLQGNVTLWPTANLNIKTSAKHNYEEYRAIIRPSGTEDVVRIIAEGPDRVVCNDIVSSLYVRRVKVVRAFD